MVRNIVFRQLIKVVFSSLKISIRSVSALSGFAHEPLSLVENYFSHKTGLN